ncbi:WD repeat-containing protein RUP2 [Syzygium oleosum]|uniref:WD repeat-containing protein RUP2 n=1 Tax=Syzygium oleosum TaxID=219896 RepID=UPI0011D181FE|nr:WD repeat-containing protein RUP2 [Syzygium oleosum]
MQSFDWSKAPQPSNHIVSTTTCTSIASFVWAMNNLLQPQKSQEITRNEEEAAAAAEQGEAEEEDQRKESQENIERRGCRDRELAITPQFELPQEDGDQRKENQENIERGGGQDQELNIAPRLEPPQEEERARCEWDFHLSAVVSSAAASSSDTLGVIEIDPPGALIATGGIARKIRIYSLSSLVPQESDLTTTAFSEHSSACSYYICTPAKLSSLRWRPGSGGRVVGSGDYDGVVTEYDLERQVPVFERDEHGGRRVWSVDYSSSGPAVGASGSDDGTMQLWDPRCGDGGRCLSMVRPGEAGRSTAVCSVEFSRFDGVTLAVGCADRRAYTYDLRNMSGPVRFFDGHAKTVTYAKFLGLHAMVSASIDGCLKLWSVADTCAVRTYRGHVNTRSFVGLSVWPDGGLIACGSESDRVFVYDARWGEPIWAHRFESGFVSSVCWKQAGSDRCTLVAGGSDGVLQLFVGARKSSS